MRYYFNLDKRRLRTAQYQLVPRYYYGYRVAERCNTIKQYLFTGSAAHLHKFKSVLAFA